MGAADRVPALDEYDVDPVVAAVLGVTALALLARLAFLGQRIAHWDEARVAWWVLEFVRTGSYEYRPILHGPFYHHVNGVVFAVLGPSDFTMRLVTAVIGGLLPLAALLLRHRLHGAETVALALFFAANPILLYYSRFMRGDLPLAAFAFVAFAFFVRAVDTGRREPLYAGTVALALGFTLKENALLYVAAWLGALVLLLDHRLFRARDRGEDWPATLGRYAGWTYRGLRVRAAPLAAAVAVFFVIVTYFYAPRGTGSGPTLDAALANPALLPAVVDEALVGSWTKLYGQWVEGGADHTYLDYLGDFLLTMGYGAAVLSALAVAGFVVDRYSRDGPRDVVSFAFYWGFVSVLGYPLVTDIKAPWATVHAVVPLAVPAAVGVGLIYRWGREAHADGDGVSVAVAALLLVLLAGQTATVAVNAVYLHPQSDSNELVQYAQPAGDLRPTLRNVDRLAAANDGPDVLFYGEYFVDGDEQAVRTPACVKWFNALPLPWYLAVNDAEVTCARTPNQLDARLREGPPPVVVARTEHRETLARRLDGYVAYTYQLRSFDTETTFFVDERRLT